MGKLILIVVAIIALIDISGVYACKDEVPIPPIVKGEVWGE